jgi:hypothetical protein
MKNKLSIEEIMEKVAERYSERVTFNEYELLLLDSGIKEDDLINFFVYIEGASFPVILNFHSLRKKLREDNFLMLFATNLFNLLEQNKKQELAYTLEGDGYFLNKKNYFSKKNNRGGFNKNINTNEKNIKSVEMYEDNRNYRILINNQFLLITKKNKYWKYVYEIAENKESFFDNIEKAKGVLSWFNSSKKNPIYKKTNLYPTKIIGINDEVFIASRNIKIKKMGQRRAYSKEIVS